MTELYRLLIEQRNYKDNLKKLSIAQLRKESEKDSCTNWKRQYIRWELLERKDESNEKQRGRIDKT